MQFSDNFIVIKKKGNKKKIRLCVYACGEDGEERVRCVFSPSAQRGKRYSLITDDKWFVSAVARCRDKARGSYALVISYLEHSEMGDTSGPGNNAGLKKLKKRARRAAITSDASRPNDRHLSRRSRRYAKSPLPDNDLPNVAVVKVINKPTFTLVLIFDLNNF